MHNLLMQPIFVGWDVSTSIVGICILMPDKTQIWKTIDLRKAKTLSKKYVLLEKGIREIKEILGDKDVVNVIEERLAGFSGGFTSKNTLLMLAAMNAVATYVIESNWKNETMRLAPISTKSIVGLKVPKGGNKKEEAVKLVRKLCDTFPYKSKKKTTKPENTLGNWVDGTDDMADAYLLALAGSKRWK